MTKQRLVRLDGVQGADEARTEPYQKYGGERSRTAEVQASLQPQRAARKDAQQIGALESATPQSAKSDGRVTGSARQSAVTAHEPQPFAVFDIDGTLIRWQLYHAVANELAKSGVIDTQSNQQIHNARMVWKKRSGNESFKEYEHALVREFYKHLDKIRVADFQNAVDRVYDEYKDQAYTYTRDLIRELKSEGYMLFAISGSQQEIIAKLAEYYGFDEAIGTRYEQEDGHFTGKEVSPLGQKGDELKKLIIKHSLSLKDSIAVGDSKGDIAMLEIVEKPIAFNPEAELYKEALGRGWKIVIERKNVIYELENRDGKYTLA